MRERSVVLHGAVRAAGERYFVSQKRLFVSHPGSPMLQERTVVLHRPSRGWRRESPVTRRREAASDGGRRAARSWLPVERRQVAGAATLQHELAVPLRLLPGLQPAPVLLVFVLRRVAGRCIITRAGTDRRY